MSDESLEDNTDQPKAEQTQPEQSVPNVTVQDLFAATQIIDAAVRRGVFSASEVSVVGNVYTRITEFLKVSAPDLFEQSAGGKDD